jgi:hypothetical protein
MKLHAAAVVAALSFALGVNSRPALAQTWTFDDLAHLTPTPFSQAQGGITASFSTLSGPQVFGINNPVLGLTTFSGGALGSPTSTSPDLRIGFSQSVSSISFLFALDTNDPSVALTLSTFLGVNPVSSTNYFGSLLASGFVEGSASSSGSLFDVVVISSTAPNLAIDNLSVSTVPEPTTMLLLGAGLAGIAVVRRRQRA